MSQALCFNDVTLSPIAHQNSLWIRAAELAHAIGYASEKSIANIYKRHESEFSSDMSVVINLSTTDIPVMTRIFSLRGCHLIAMFARTPVAKEFRRWVRDVLDRLAVEERERQVVTGCQQLPLTPSTAAERKPLRSLVSAWSKVSGQHFDALWPQVKAHFELSRIDDLPVEWLPDALAWVQAKIDATTTQKALPQEKRLAATSRKRVPGPVETELEALRGEFARLSCNATEFRDTLARIRKVTLPVYHETFVNLGWHERCGVGVDYVSEMMGASYYRSLEHMRDAHDEARRYLATFLVLARLEEL